MRVVVQRVKQAQVSVKGEVVGRIGHGGLIFLGVGHDDEESDADYLADKIAGLRIFEDEDGKMNKSAEELGLAFLVVSQFTLYADCSKGRRPSFTQAAPPDKGERLYEYFSRRLAKRVDQVETGQFRATMEVELINDGPVTLLLESKKAS